MGGKSEPFTRPDRLIVAGVTVRRYRDVLVACADGRPRSGGLRVSPGLHGYTMPCLTST